MNRIAKRVISIVLVCSIMLCGAVQVFASASDKDSITYVDTYEDAVNELAANSDKKDEYVPTILIHGIAQMDTFIVDENGNKTYDENGKAITGWPIYVDTNEIIKKVAFPLVATLLTQQDFASKAAHDAVCNALKYNSCKPDGTPTYNTMVERKYCPVSEMTSDEKNIVYDHVPMQKYSEIVGEENLYYFGYNSSGDTTVLAKELNDYIEMVKEQRHCSQVNLAPISMGGTIASAWLEMFSGRYQQYDANYQSVHKIVFIIAALDGSNIVGDIMTDQTLLNNDEYLYNKLIPALMDDTWTAYAINLVLRLLPNAVLHKIIDSIMDGAMETLVVNTPLLWSLLPSGYFDEAYSNLLANKGSEYDILKAKINLYHTAQVNLQKNMNDFIAQGGVIHDICSYGLELYTIGNSSLYINSDTIIHSASTGMQTTFANLGETLGSNYVSKNPVCTDKTHNHISPDGVADVSTSYLPENTWLVYGLNHERTGRSDSVINFATILLVNDDIKDVHSNPEKYPQFNGARVTKDLIRNDIPAAQNVDKSTLTDAQRIELETALNDCIAMLDETVVDTAKSQERIDRLHDALVDCGVYQAEEVSQKDVVLKDIFKAITKINNFVLGNKGFSEIRFF